MPRRFAANPGGPTEAPVFAADTPVVQWAQRLAGTQRMGVGAVGIVTEGAGFTSSEIPAVLLVPGSFEQAYKPVELNTYAKVAACEQFFASLIESPLSIA